MNITHSAIFLAVSLAAVFTFTVYTLGEMLKKLRLQVLALRLEVEKARKTFDRHERHKRKMLYQQKETYLKLPISQREKERL